MASVFVTVGFATKVSEAARASARKIKEELDRRCGTQEDAGTHVTEAVCSMDLQTGALTIMHRVLQDSGSAKLMLPPVPTQA